MTRPSPGNLILGAGELYLDRIDQKTGKNTGLRHLGNVSNFTISTTVETKKKYSSMEAAKGLLASVPTQISCTGKLSMDYYQPENLALGMMGEDGVLTQTAQTGLTKTFAAVRLGRLYSLGKKKVSNVILESDLGGMTYVLNEDYTIDLLRGYWEPLIGGAITDDSTVKATFDTQAGTFPKISGLVAPRIEGMLYFKGDPTYGPVYEAEIWKASIIPDGDIGFITEDWGSFGITLDIMNDAENHPDDPYFRYLRLK